MAEVSPWRFAVLRARASAFLDRFTGFDVMRKSAALSYYAAFSTVPILVIALWIGALVVDATDLRGYLQAQVGAIFGAATADWIDRAIASAGETRNGVAAIVSIVLLVVGATTSLAELRSSLDEIFGVEHVADSGWRSLVRARAYAVGLIVTLGFLLVVSLFANAVLASSLSWTGQRFGIPGAWVTRLISEGSTLLGVGALFAAVYAWLPSRHIGARAVIRATLISAVLFTVGRWVIATWFATSAAVSTFGAAATLALVLLWFYYSAAIFYTAAILAADPEAAARAKEPAEG